MRSALRPAVSACLFALLLGACATLPKPLDAPESDAAEMAMSESDRINAWFDEKYEESLQFSPMSLTFLGRKDQYTSSTISRSKPRTSSWPGPRRAWRRCRRASTTRS